MLLDLAESLACPRCGPPQGLIVLVERMDGRRIEVGRLDCPACEARLPLAHGRLDFRGPAAREVGRPSDLDATISDSQADADSVVVAALFGIREGGGLLVVDSALGKSAAGIAELSGGCEVVYLEGRSSGSHEGEPGDRAMAVCGDRVTCLRGVSGDSIPILSARALGVALAMGGPQEIEEAARILTFGGRLVILRPGPAALALGDDPRFELLARDDRAIVARRT